MKKTVVAALLAALTCVGCGSHQKDEKILKVAASPVPHSQMLEFVKKDLREKYGINLKIVKVDDYSLANRALAEKEVDANFFQHAPFLQDQKEQFKYHIECYAKIHVEPMGIYSKRVKSLQELKEGSTIAIPSDPTNEYRALMLLQEQGLIKVKQGASFKATKLDIVQNPKKIKFKEVDAALLARVWEEVDAAAIPTNFALTIGLKPSQDALALETAKSPYVNLLVIREGMENDPRLKALKEELLSDKMRAYILKEYHGSVVPVLEECS